MDRQIGESGREGRCEMRRTLVVLAIVVLGVVLIATPGLVAARGGNGGGDGASFTLKGTIDALDSDDRTIVVTVVSPLSLAKLNPLTVQTTGETRFKECDGSKISFGDLASGDIIKVAGVVDGGSFIATRVILQYSLPE